MPEGRMEFDERGIAVDGTLEHEGVQLDLRTAGMVAILVSRHAIAPDALHDDDDAIRGAVLHALRLRRTLDWLMKVAVAGTVGMWIWCIVAGLIGGWRLDFLLAPLLVTAVLVSGRISDRRRMSRL